MPCGYIKGVSTVVDHKTAGTSTLSPGVRYFLFPIGLHRAATASRFADDPELHATAT